MLWFFTMPVNAVEVVSLLIIRPALACIIGLWLLGYVKYQSALLRKYVTQAIFISIVCIPVIALIFSPVEIPIIPDGGLFNTVGLNLNRLLNDGVIVLVVLYMSGVFYQLLRLGLDVLAARHLAKSATLFSQHLQPDWLQRQLKSFESKLQVRISTACISPVTWGFVRPVLLLPSNFLSLPESVQKQMIDHELTHIKRDDWVLLIFARLCCCMFWHLPWVWQLHRNLVEVIENACDDAVLEAGHASHSYATTLIDAVKFGQWNRIALSLSNKPFLYRRIESVLDKFIERDNPSVTIKSTVAIASIFVFLPLSLFEVTTFDRPLSKLDQSHYSFMTVDLPKISPLSELNKRSEKSIQQVDLQALLVTTEAPKRVRVFHDGKIYSNTDVEGFSRDFEVLEPETILLSDEVIYRAVKTVMPVYPERALVRGKEGSVTVSFNVMADGGVANFNVIDAQPKGYFERSVSNALVQFKFKAISDQARPISQTMIRKFIFRLSGPAGKSAITAVSHVNSKQFL